MSSVKMGFLAKAFCLLLGFLGLLSFTSLSVNAESSVDLPETEYITTPSLSGDALLDCKVSVSVEGGFTVTIPKNISLSADSYSSDYIATVKGDIASNECVTVLPDFSFVLCQKGKADVGGLVSQEKTSFYPFEIAREGGRSVKGSVTVPSLSAGSWRGVFSFYINIAPLTNIPVQAINKEGDVVEEVYAYEITGEEKSSLLNALGQKGLASDLDFLLSMETDFLTELAKVTFDVLGIAQEADTVGIVYFNEKKSEWEFIQADAVTDGKVVIDFSDLIFCEDGSLHKHEYAFTSTTASCLEKGISTYECSCKASYEEEALALGHLYVDEVCTRCGYSIKAGLYDSKGVMLASWDELTTVYGLDLEETYTSSTYATKATSMYGVLNNNSKFTDATRLIIGDDITIINMHAMSYVDSLKEVVVPSTVSTIGNSAFEGCSSLESITLQEGIKTLEYGAFNGCTKLKSIVFPSTISSFGDTVCENCTALTTVTFTDGITAIGESNFKGCTSLTKVQFPDSLLSLGTRNFWGCTVIKKVVIPDSITVLGEYNFYNCTSLEQVSLPSNLTSIGEYAFYFCPIKTLVIPDKVTTIDSRAFSHNKSLSSVIVPVSLTTVKSGAFANASQLKTVYYKGTAEQWKSISIAYSNDPFEEANIIYNYSN